MMSLGRSSLLALAIAAVLALPVALAAQASEVGTWVLNVAKSKYTPGPGPKSQTLKYEAAGQGVKVSTESISATGDKTSTSYTANYDGKDVPITGSATADTVSLKRINATTVERTDKKGGKVVTTITRVMSADGKTLTITTKGTNAQGQPTSSVAVYEKKM